jgi:DNA-binding response OmpR family regulator
VARVVLASRDTDQADWLAGVLGQAGLSVSVVDDLSSESPELRGAELAILDEPSAEVLGEAGPSKRVLLASRDGTVDLNAVRSGFADILALPVDDEEAVARIQHVLDT